MVSIPCFSCGGSFPDMEGPTHRYMLSSPGCWATYGEVLAREYEDRGYFAVHRLTVDAYAVQHPGSTDRQSIQSVGLHLVRLCLFLEHDLQPEHADTAMRQAAEQKHRMIWLEPPGSLGAITTADVAKVTSAQEHTEKIRDWARCVWDAWSAHHGQVRAWLPDGSWLR